jgi:hypothetical protein
LKSRANCLTVLADSIARVTRSMRAHFVAYLLTLGAVTPVAAQELDEPAKIRALVDELSLDAARARLRRAFKAGGASAAQLAKLHLVAGELAVTTGSSDEAMRSFGRALLLEPGIALPAGSSPKVAGSFNTAKTLVADRRLRAKVHSERVAPETVRTHVVIENDLFDFVASAQLEAATKKRALVSASRDHFVVEWPCAQRSCEARVSIRDADGNRLLDAAVPQIVELPVEPRAPAEARAWYQQGGTYLALSAATTAAAVFFGYRSWDAEQRLRSFANTPQEHYYFPRSTTTPRCRRRTPREAAIAR